MKNYLTKTEIIFTSFFASANVFTLLKNNLLKINFNTYSSKNKLFVGSKFHLMQK